MLKVYNTLTKKKEVLKPRKGKKVNLFVCGPTTYDFSHIGHARTYIVFDMIAKYLKQKGYDVFYLQNITDIDDKIITRAKREKTVPRKLALLFEKEYLKDMKSLNVNSVTKYAKATNHIKEIIKQVKILSKKGFAYQIKNGIYYDISKFKNYGKLSRRTILQAEDAVSRIDQAKGKKNRGDFCLWKFSKKGEPKWPSPFGAGRPGWHIEDTAITEKYFGSQYDIHGGARDLTFPHHEAEIAQMEAISGKSPMVKYWLHTGFLTVKGKKMAKSLGNFITIRDFLKNHSASPVEEFRKDFSKEKLNLRSDSKFLYGARILRLFVLKSHYLSPINYSEKEIEQAKKQLERIDEFTTKIKKAKGKTTAQSKKLIKKTKESFEKAMEDDFNTPVALSSLFKLITKGNSLLAKNKLALTDAKEILKFLKEVDKIFNFIFWGKKETEIPSSIKQMAKEREQARKKKDWKKADELRKKIKQMGFWVEDTKKGPTIKRI